MLLFSSIYHLSGSTFVVLVLKVDVNLLDIPLTFQNGMIEVCYTRGTSSSSQAQEINNGIMFYQVQ